MDREALYFVNGPHEEVVYYRQREACALCSELFGVFGWALRDLLATVKRLSLGADRGPQCTSVSLHLLLALQGSRRHE